MITLIELNHTLTKVAAGAGMLPTEASQRRSQELREALRAVAWMLSQDIEKLDTPAGRESRRQLRIETTTLLAELDTALRLPTPVNIAAVRHRARAWNVLLLRARPALGIAQPARQHRPPGLAARS